MDSLAGNTPRAEALALISAGLDLLDAAGLTPDDGSEAVALVKAIEQVRRRVDSAGVRLITEIEGHDLALEDGYASAKSMVRHHARLSNAAATARYRSAKACVTLPAIGAAYQRGNIATANMGILGRLHSNPRVAQRMRCQEQWFLQKAVEERPNRFAQTLRQWESLADENGATPEADRHHNQRRFHLHQSFNQSWFITGNCGSMQGAAINEIHGHYLAAETLADWETAKAEHGDDARAHHLPRTVQQRSADALYQIFQDAAANQTGSVPAQLVHNIIWAQETFEHYLTVLSGEPARPLHPDHYRCETIDGVQLNPIEAITSAVVSQVRRVVVDAQGTVIDLGKARHFTGNARAAVKLGSTECVWPSCRVATTHCETDHLVEHSKHGRTNPGNGAPLCGKHNRWKQKGFRVWRDPHGNWHTQRPDGTEIDP